jgi:hypothetical protein
MEEYSNFQPMFLLPLPPMFGVNDSIGIPEEKQMVIQPSTKLSTQTLVALLALAGGCAPGAAMDYRDNYGNNSYYGNIYGNNSGYDNGNYNSNNDDGGMGDSSHRHHHKHPITGNECSNDAAAGANCGASP